jgi:hypothetical protein
MSLWPFQHWISPRQVVATLSLAAFLAATAGLPVIHPWLSPLGKDLSQPFPCQHSACGCQNAEACWRGCCCRTNRQKLAWAEEHGVKAPTYVAQQAQREKVVGSCCLNTKKPSGVFGGSACCASARADAANDSRPPDRPLPWALSLSARKCQGLPQLWLILSAAMPVPPATGWQFSWQIADDVSLESTVFDSLAQSPATPPPRA